MRRFVTPRAFVRLCVWFLLLGLVFGLFGLLAFPHSASARDVLNPSANIRDYVVASHGLEDATKTRIFLYSRGDWVTLKGPITVSVFIDDNGRRTTETVTIRSEQTYTIGFKYGGTSPPEWNSTITLLSVDMLQDIDVLELVFGASAQQMLDYVDQHMTPAAISAGLQSAREAGDALTTTLIASGGSSEFPNMDRAATVFTAIALLAGAKDKDTNRPLFPSLQSSGIQKVLTRMTVGGAESTNSLAATDALVSLLCGMDMAQQSKQSGQPPS